MILQKLQISLNSKCREFVVEFDKQGNVIRVNSCFSELVGQSKSELLGRHHREVWSVQSEDGFEYNGFWNDLRIGIRRDFINSIKVGDGLLRLAESYVPIKVNDQVEKVIWHALVLSEGEQEKKEISLG